jgi:hypothetical protein
MELYYMFLGIFLFLQSVSSQNQNNKSRWLNPINAAKESTNRINLNYECIF